jgi:hypothetical protein
MWSVMTFYFFLFGLFRSRICSVQSSVQQSTLVLTYGARLGQA